VSQAVAEALRQTGFPSDQLNIEATEDAVVEPTASADLQAISDMGVQLSIDNVGTNWSSFEPFKRHAISTVKIDGSFIAGLESNQGINRLVVETVIHMAHSLGMSAIVERVENAAQLQIAAGFGADAAQGFFFSHPLARADARMFAAGPDIPVFSRTEGQTLLLADGIAVPVESLLTEVEPEPDASAAPPAPHVQRLVPDVGMPPRA
jgi:EAL domain-containing protein (putative c-di-GMP-specific phosphodiesterase class I)